MLIRTHQHPYHVISRCRNRENFPLALSELWPLILDELWFLHRHQRLRVHAFVLMGNHFHLLCQTPEQNLDECMQYFLRALSLKLSPGRPLWDQRYKWSLITAPAHYYQVYRYVYQNPVRAGFTERVEDWPFSTLHPVPFPVCADVPMAFGGLEGEQHWLNELYGAEEQKLIRLGLRKFQFDVAQRAQPAFRRLTPPMKD
jgi:REP element-mobilizing transposase RayT